MRQRRPICPTCGRPIAKLPKGQGPTVARVYRLDAKTSKQNALDSGSYNRPSVHHTADGRTSEYGTLGDNVFCGAGCGWLMAVRLVRAIGISDVFRMLPPDYNPEVFATIERDKRRAKSRERYKRDKERMERTQDQYIAVATSDRGTCNALGWAALSIRPYILAEGSDADDVLERALSRAGHDEIHIEKRS